jgi:hypothetical protein
MTDHIEPLFYTVHDPENLFHDGMPVPAITTLLYKVCQNDHQLFDEAVRLMRLMMEAAYEKGTTARGLQ